MTNIEAILAEFEKQKRNWELYGSLGMGIAYPKLKSWLKSKLTSFEKEIREDEKKKWKERPFVDATPDGEYALRLLQSARRGCDVVFSDNTAGITSDNPLIVEMNRLNDKRKKELDIAIKSLSTKEE